MRIPLERQSAVPLYRQITAYLREGILTGSLAPETRLPASRRLARDLGTSRITVESAYAELEADGLVCFRAGSGTYVLPFHPVPPVSSAGKGVTWPLWQLDLRARQPGAEADSREEVPDSERYPETISFAGGGGDPRLFPADEFRRVMQTVMRRDGLAALEYGECTGYAPLRGMIARVLGSQGVTVAPENILITCGSQEALSLVAQSLLGPGDVVLVEEPTYAGALELFQTLGLKTLGIPTDDRGMMVENLEELLQRFHPRLIYTIPNFQNPTGACLSGQRRRQLVNLADRYNVPVLEDDFVGDLRYAGHAQPALKALDPGGRVIYVSTFSKMLLPGIRVGFAAAEGPVFAELAKRKRAHDLATSSLVQRALEAYVTVGRYQTHLNRSCQIYRKRRDAMLSAIDRHLPSGVTVNSPQGGLFVWLRLPESVLVAGLLPLAREAGVSFAPGGSFYADGYGDGRCLRLNFASRTEAEIEEGTKRLGQACRRLMHT